jgi:hypothetical protein
MSRCGGSGKVVCTSGVWEVQDGGPCPVSTRTAKKNIHYLTDTEVRSVALQTQGLRLASYEYRDPALGRGPKLGIIIEDAPAAPAVDGERRMVDVYGFASMLLATVQEQERRIAELERRCAPER